MFDTKKKKSAKKSEGGDLKYLGGLLLAKMAFGGAARLRSNADEVNKLNVFPVPDGDTGDNMRMTVESGIAAIENLDIKKSVFAELDTICKAETIFASNTSSISITAIAAATKRADKFIGMHFFNPATVLKLVEVIRGEHTSDETFQTIWELSEAIGKTPVEVNEAPGFVVNKILIPMINEAIDLVYTGVATVEGIDTAMKLGANHPMGPLALGDLVGLDVCLAIMDTIYNETHDPKYRASLLLRKMVRAGKLGRKTGEGFYKY